MVLSFSEQADSVSNTAVILDLFGRPLSVSLLVLCALGAALACMGKVRSLPWLVLCLWPQQALQTFAALGALKAIWLGAYADGLIRPSIYIFQDQMPFVWFVVGHALGVWQLMAFMRRS